MSDRKRLPEGLAVKQELQRQETINKVLRAAADIKNEGKKVTISSLMEYTGLSRSTFAKPHIRELLVGYGYATANGAVRSPKRAIVGHTEIISEKDSQIKELKAKNVELERECELLRGRILLLMQRE